MSSRSRAGIPRPGHPSMRDQKRALKMMHAQTEQLVKALETCERDRQHAVLTLLAVLAHSGGLVTVTVGTLQQTQENARRMAYTVRPRDPVEGQEPTEFDIVLVEHEAEAAEEMLNGATTL